MAITCPKCGKEFDVTLFQFGNTVRCDCGASVDISVGHVLDTRPGEKDGSDGTRGQTLDTTIDSGTGRRVTRLDGEQESSARASSMDSS
jgi:hypothetical protein